MRRKLTVGSCFSGIGGLELGLERTGGFETKWQIENDPYASAVLAKHWPSVVRYGDITSVDASQLEPVDLICGGFPCQDISDAGARAGITGKRSGLWKELLRAIRMVRPRFALVENVAALLRRGMGTVCGDLAESGYDAQWDCIPAAAVGADHRRDRVFIVAHPPSERRIIFRDQADFFQNQLRRLQDRWKEIRKKGIAEIERLRLDSVQQAAESGICVVVDGVSQGMDQQLKCIGNSVDPRVAQKVGEMILHFEASR